MENARIVASAETAANAATAAVLVAVYLLVAVRKWWMATMMARNPVRNALDRALVANERALATTFALWAATVAVRLFLGGPVLPWLVAWLATASWVFVTLRRLHREVERERGLR